VRQYEQRTGMLPQTWIDMVNAGYLRGLPVDPDRYFYQLNPYWGTVTLAPNSTLNPLPLTEQARP
jgi:hypothetical protein